MKKLMTFKQELPNYLLLLDDKKYIKKGSDSIRVYNIGEIIKRIYTELKAFKSIDEIEKETKTCHQTYSNWILEKTGASIQELRQICRYWKITCNKKDKQFHRLWNEIYTCSDYFGCTNGKNIKLPKKLDNNLAYLLGVIMGDGHIADPDKFYDKFTTYNSEIRITDGNKETFIKLSKIFEKLFNYKPAIYSELSKTNKRFYRFVIRSKPLHRFLMKICQIPVGAKYNKICIPKIINNSTMEVKKSFITGFFDADGCIRLAQDKYPEISISQLNPKILKSIILICRELGIKWNGPYKADSGRNHGSHIKLSNKENVEKFLNHFPPFNPIKIKQSEILWKTLKSRPISQSKWMEIEGGEEKIKAMS